ncbi:MAG TPA: ATP-binding protein [Phycisphaerales bacterium]|nr:ATP-binding protein [Phycisphaerales bacterium]
MTALAETKLKLHGTFEPKLVGPPGAGGGALAPSDLAELLAAFNEVTAKLHAAHESLKEEVVRLQGELRQANEQIERSRRLSALGEMAAGIAHEVRNPLGSIRLYAKMLADDLAVGEDRSKERTLAEKIGAATRGLDAVVCDVLAFSREMRVEAGPIEVGALLQRAIDECLAGDRDEARAVGGAARPPIRVVRLDEAAELDGEIVMCDAHLMHRALVNVVRNAIEAMREATGDHARGRELRLAVERRMLPDAQGKQKGFVAMVVHDSGPGIPAGVMERMFNPFFTTRATGTGLGLAIVHRIMDAHGGRVLVRNADGAGGAIVELLLPDVG